MCASDAIVNLIHSYAERIDAGDFAGVAHLLHDARIILNAQGVETTGPGLQAMFEDSIILYPDGTPRTKHLVTNLVVEFDGDDVARARSSYLVLQQLPGGPLKTLITGRYRDRFSRVDGEWRWTERDYTLVDLVGDQSEHLRVAAS